MENSFKIFKHNAFGKIRIIVINGVIWLVGRDVAIALGYSNASKAVIAHVDEEDRMILNQKDLEKMASESKSPNLGTLEFEFDSPRGLTFINESGLYSLILSSKLPDAKEFKRWITSEVLPAIRKYGSYSLPQKENAVAVQNSVELKLLVAPALKDVETSIEIVEKMFFVQHGIALAHCINAAEKNHQVDLSDFKNLLPPAEHEIGYLTATQIGKNIGKSAQYVNKKLLEFEFQEKDGHGGYILTEKGKDYGEAMPFERNGHAGYQIKWAEEILSLLK